MATNNRPLKAFVRFDGTGRAVSSSLIWRKNKPKVGNWKEVQGYECCDGGGGCVPQLSDEIVTTGIELPPFPFVGTFSFEIILFSSSCYNFSWSGNVSIDFSNWDDVLTFLNTNFSYFGLFSYTAPNIISLQISSVGPLGSCSNPYFLNMGFAA
jgi:hypothetical protein